MPTGYTAAILDGCTFEKFILSCAHAFGACIMQRDDGVGDSLVMDTVGDYYRKRVADAESNLERLRNMEPQEIDAAHDAAIADAKQNAAGYLDRIAKKRTLYNAMRVQAENWVPPSAEHAELKKFMLKQIDQSADYDCNIAGYSDNTATRLEAMSPPTWHKIQVEAAERELVSAQKSLADEEQRTRDRNEWKQQLCESIGVKFC